MAGDPGVRKVKPISRKRCARHRLVVALDAATPALTPGAKRYEDCVLDDPQAETSPMYGYSVAESGVGPNS
jgi:hypothetical protein